MPETPGLVGADGRELGIGHIRVSTQPQELGTSPQNQSESILAASQRCNIHIPEAYLISETGSGADFGRPGLKIVCSIIVSGKVQHFFAHDPDCVARDPLHLVQFLSLGKDHGVTVHFSDGAVGKSIIDEAMQYPKGFFGFQEREKIAGRTVNANRKVALLGRMPHGSGRGLYGYDYDPDLKIRTINEAEAAVVRKIYHRALGGEVKYAIVRDLRERGIKTKTGYLFHPLMVHNILRNETNTGEHWWGTRRYEKLLTTEKRRSQAACHSPARRPVDPPRRFLSADR